MRRMSRKIYALLFIFIGLGVPIEVLAFKCGNTGEVVVNVDAIAFRNQTVTFSTNPGLSLVGYGAQSAAESGIPAAPSGAGFYCVVNTSYGDRVAITGISNIHDAITSSYYASKINISSNGLPGSPGSTDYTFSSVGSGTGACLLCGSAIDTWYRVNTPLITVTLTRAAGWVAKPINNGDILFRLTVRRTDGGGTAIGTIVFRMTGDAVYPTCDIKNFDNNVILPSVKRTDLVSHGTGRYAGTTKEFNINLACENAPKVSVKFDGDKMPGITSEDVLVNKLSGNDNVGVQILYGSNPLKIGSNVTVLSAAGTNESLKFNAYYYYKGGDVQSGPVKSQSEFTFTYE